MELHLTVAKTKKKTKKKTKTKTKRCSGGGSVAQGNGVNFPDKAFPSM